MYKEAMMCLAPDQTWQGKKHRAQTWQPHMGSLMSGQESCMLLVATEP